MTKPAEEIYINIDIFTKRENIYRVENKRFVMIDIGIIFTAREYPGLKSIVLAFLCLE